MNAVFLITSGNKKIKINILVYQINLIYSKELCTRYIYIHL